MFGRSKALDKPTVTIGEGGNNTHLQCTYCGGTDFFAGPSGGMSQNVLCSNDKCRHWFNWTPAIASLDDLKKIEPTPDEAANKKARELAARDEELGFLIAQGRESFLHGKSFLPLLGNLRRSSFMSDSDKDYVRLIGYLNAAARSRDGDQACREPAPPPSPFYATGEQPMPGDVVAFDAQDGREGVLETIDVAGDYLSLKVRMTDHDFVMEFVPRQLSLKRRES